MSRSVSSRPITISSSISTVRPAAGPLTTRSRAIAGGSLPDGADVTASVPAQSAAGRGDRGERYSPAMSPPTARSRGRGRPGDRHVDPDRRRAADRAPRRRCRPARRRRGDLSLARAGQPRPQRLLRDRGPRLDQRHVRQRPAHHRPADALGRRHGRGRRRPPWSCASSRFPPANARSRRFHRSPRWYRSRGAAPSPGDPAVAHRAPGDVGAAAPPKRNPTITHRRSPTPATSRAAPRRRRTVAHRCTWTSRAREATVALGDGSEPLRLVFEGEAWRPAPS